MHPSLRIGLVTVPTRDLARSVAFYRDVLGFEEQNTVPEFGRSTLTAGAVRLGLFIPGMGGGNRRPGGSVGFTLAVDDLGPVYEQLVQRGASMPNGIFHADDGQAWVEVHDPDDNVLKIVQPAAAHGAGLQEEGSPAAVEG